MINYNDYKESFNEYLDEIYAPIIICGVEWSYSYVYEQIDAMSYEIELIDWVDEMMEVGE